MMKRISRDPAEQTPFERFYLEWPKLLEDAGFVLYGANGLSEIGWEHRAAFLLFEAMGSPDWRDRPPPPEPHGGAWIGDPLVEHIDADVYADLKAKQDADDPFACLDAPAEQPQDDDPFAIL